jgi:hypothetical protein
MAFITKYWKQILIFLVIVTILIVAYGGWSKLMIKIRRAQYARRANVDPGSFDAYPDAMRLSNAMDGAGTNENLIWSALEGKTPDQLAAIYTEFGNIVNENGQQGDLFDWFNDDLSGDDLNRALAYFTSVTFT